ncbi:hypothetical protein BDZ45DRAFT_394999 [Acephala macrosclerotiorum]|nr:hypothetical protein BDZ45DRAFT_394999 [Acephala macrosclerotiorum]
MLPFNPQIRPKLNMFKTENFVFSKSHRVCRTLWHVSVCPIQGQWEKWSHIHSILPKYWGERHHGIQQVEAPRDLPEEYSSLIRNMGIRRVRLLDKGRCKSLGFRFRYPSAMDRKRWLKNGLDIGDGIEGKWEARNRVVWRVLKSILRLITKILGYSATHLWYDAVIHPNGPHCLGSNLKMVADLEICMRLELGVRRPLLLMIWKFGNSGKSWQTGRVNGYTEIFASGKYSMKALRLIQATLSLETLAPLIKLNLTVAERLMQQFLVVKIIIHEPPHASGNYMRCQSGDNVPFARMSPEPFFEDEEKNEYGRSIENTIWGGYVQQAWQENVFLEDWRKMKSRPPSPSTPSPERKLPTYSFWFIGFNYLHDYKDGQVKHRDQKIRFRFLEIFQENAVC